MGAWHLGKLSGIDVRVHWTFLLLPAWVFLTSVAGGSGAVAASVSVLFILAVFGCVLLHEMGHALMARCFGIPTRNITLLPIGGVASLQRMPRQPSQELAIAVAGPLVNVVIATVLFVGLGLVPVTNTLTTLLTQLALVNVALVIFNMLPAFPMDGGRVLRAILATYMRYERATGIAATVGQVTAILFGVLGLLSGNLILALIAAFIYFAAKGEQQRVDGESIDRENSSERVREKLLRNGGFPFHNDAARVGRGGSPSPPLQRTVVVTGHH